MDANTQHKNALRPGYELETGSHKYRIDSVIDAGGFGITYRATNLRAFSLRGFTGEVIPEGASLAIKECFMRPSADGREYMRRREDGYVELVNESIGYAQREAFFNEGRCLLKNLRKIGRCDYTRFVPLYHAGWLSRDSAKKEYKDAGILFLVMPYLSGGTLKKYRFAHPGEFVCCMYELLLTLEVLHAGKVYHRDIKPANIMLDASKRPVLIDFGLSGDVVVSRGYTKGYASPEQFRRERNVGAESDIYSLGVSFYELLTGVRPANAKERMSGSQVMPMFRMQQVRKWLEAYGARFEQIFRNRMNAEYSRLHGGAHFVDVLLYSIDLAMMTAKEKRFPTAAVWRNYVFSGLAPRYGVSENAYSGTFTGSSVRQTSASHPVNRPIQQGQPVQQPVQRPVQSGQPAQLPVQRPVQHGQPMQQPVQGASLGEAIQQGIHAVRRAGEVVQDARRVAGKVGRVAHNVNQVANIVNQVPFGVVQQFLPEHASGLQQGMNALRDIGNVARGVENVANAVQGGRVGGSLQEGAHVAHNVGNMLDRLNLHEAAGMARDAGNVMNTMNKGKEELERLKNKLGGLFGS